MALISLRWSRTTKVDDKLKATTAISIDAVCFYRQNYDRWERQSITLVVVLDAKRTRRHLQATATSERRRNSSTFKRAARV